MKQITIKRNSNQCEDDLVRYKINKNYINSKSPAKIKTKKVSLDIDDETVRYKLPSILSKAKQEKKTKTKPKIKVNFWSNKLNNRLHNTETKKSPSNGRHTAETTNKTSLTTKPKTTEVKVRKQVSFLPSPLFSENHAPMVTVPDDLTLQLNEEEANDLREDLNNTYTNNIINISNNDSNELHDTKRISPQTSPRSNKHSKGHGNENELEFFSKYVVQKLRRMETNQRIYSENLINTVLMLGQLGKLNGKSKINES